MYQYCRHRTCRRSSDHRRTNHHFSHYCGFRCKKEEKIDKHRKITLSLPLFITCLNFYLI
jgi:hypothetical protein